MNKKHTSSNEKIEMLKDQLAQLNERYEHERSKTKEYERTLNEMEWLLQTSKQNRLIQLMEPKRLKQHIQNAGAYLLGRRNLKRLYSRTYKRKQAQNDLLPYVRLLYEEGFTERALKDLHEWFQTTTNQYVKRAIASELARYYANVGTEFAARRALMFINDAKANERDETVRRQLTVIEAECLVRIGEMGQAKQVVQKELKRNSHPDLYLALANTEEHLTDKIKWLNQVYHMYKRRPIQLDLGNMTQMEPYYNILHYTKEAAEKHDGPKVSVILPAYNSEDSIHIAIESLLKQSWNNMELIIVDDCSTDRTREVIERYIKQDERIKYLRNEKNSGPYVARNLALKEATGEFVTVNDADDWSHEEKLTVQAMHLIENPNVIANTSEQARLTGDFMFHRRGTRGIYIFSNMSSLMFRRKEVLERIGYWDRVRFAADGEFKRRLIKEFGKDRVVDLKTGPLSLPQQSATSLTGSSAFGYNGFFMGARKEYVESFTDYHKRANSLYYPYEPEKRLFPVPEPMLPERIKAKKEIDIVIVANFYDLSDDRANIILKQIKENKEKKLTTGLVQLYDYNTKVRRRSFNEKIRRIINGTNVQMLVYGEKINAQIVLIHTVESLAEKQTYIPFIDNRITILVIDELPKMTYNVKEERTYNVRQAIRQAMEYFSHELRIYPLNQSIREALETQYRRDIGNIRLAMENWVPDQGDFELQYLMRLNDWFVDEHDYTLK